MKSKGCGRTLGHGEACCEGYLCNECQWNENLSNQMESIPMKNFYHADRYDTSDEYILHLWDDEGNSFDIRIPKNMEEYNMKKWFK